MPAERCTCSLTCQKASQSVVPAFCVAWGPLVSKKHGFVSTKREFTCGSSPQGERVGGQGRDMWGTRLLHVLCGKREKTQVKARFLQCGSMVAQ